MSSYQLSQRVNAQTLLWVIGGAIISTGRLLSAVVGRCFAIVSHFLPLLLLALGLTLGIAVVAAAVAMIPPTFWLGLAVIATFGYLTFPKAKVVK